MRDPIYKPKGAALEYANYALNIYTGCPHGCSYCYVPAVLRKSKAEFHSDVRPRDGIIEAVETQLAKGKIKDQLIHLCFTCDPYTCLPLMRLVSLAHAKRAGIRTWVSVEPVLSVSNAYHLIKNKAMNTCYDRISFGKLNYQKSDIDWKTFGNTIERLCKRRKINYTIKDSLRKEMER